MQAQALTIELDSPDDWPGFRAACRALLAHGADPAVVRWRWPDTRGAQQLGAGVDLFSSTPQQAMPASALAGLAGPGEAGLSLSETQMSALRHACLHRAAGRFELCHRWLARMQARPELRLDALDADWRAIEALARPVSREIDLGRILVALHRLHGLQHFSEVRDRPGHQPGRPVAKAGQPVQIDIRLDVEYVLRIDLRGQLPR